ncbi:MAG: hypothetical protein QW781_00230 [Methanothrix sp.]|uniref:DUF3147 domain-containing protein n=1 Tax=Methanothrix sp. TaxID=90426 RepID=UPI0031673C24|nr:hypothetical protein [Methanothrix sp.]
MRLLIYFVLGGAITALVVHLGSSGRGTLSAFIATFPVLTALTFILISMEGSSADLCEYARGLLLFTPAWIAYVLTVLFTFERLGVWLSIALGMAVYAVASWILRTIIMH